MAPAYDKLSSQVIAAAIEVHKRLGPGFLENIYDQALRFELEDRGIPYESQKRIKILYGDREAGEHVLDLLVADRLVVELKAIKQLEDVHYAQVRSYLRALGLQVGLLFNFNSQPLDIRRVVPRFENRTGPLIVPHQ